VVVQNDRRAGAICGGGAKAHSANAGRRVNFTHDLRMPLRGAIIAFIRHGINDNPRRLPVVERHFAERKSAGEKKPVQR